MDREAVRIEAERKAQAAGDRHRALAAAKATVLLLEAGDVNGAESLAQRTVDFVDVCLNPPTVTD